MELSKEAQNLHETLRSTHTDYGSTRTGTGDSDANNNKGHDDVGDHKATTRQFSQSRDIEAITSRDNAARNISRFSARTNASAERLPTFVRLRAGEFRETRYARMSLDTMPNSETRQILQRLEHTLNVLNQICIGFVTIYLSWLTIRTGLSGTGLHAFLVTIGFSFFMAEGVMIHYGDNVLMTSYTRNTKTTIHWILMALGGVCGASGALIKMIQKGFLLSSLHGKLGFTAFILCLISMSSGLGALFSYRFRKLVSPLLSKTFHNFLGFATFVIALVAQYYGYQTGYFTRRAEKDFIILIKCLTLISLVLSCIGPIKALIHKFKNIQRHFN